MNTATQIYYLFSQDSEHMEFEYTMHKYEKVDPDHMNNLFKVIHIKDNIYKIIHIYKNKGLDGKFKINDIIYFSSGMVSFYTLNENDEIDQIECLSSVLKKEEKITLFNENIDDKINELNELITQFNDTYDGCLIDPKYKAIKRFLEK